MRLHEEQRHARQCAGDAIDIAPQHRREVGVGDRRLPARHEAQQRTGLVTGRNLGEARFGRERRDAPLVLREGPGVHQRDCNGIEAPCPRICQCGANGRLVERRHLAAIGADPARDLQHIAVEHGRKTNIEVEQPRTRLVADAQKVAEALVDDEQNGRAPPFQQRVGGDGRAHANLGNRMLGYRCLGRECENVANAGDGGIVILARILGQELAGDDAAVGVSGDDVGEGASAIDPELPRTHRPTIHAKLPIR